MSKHQQALIIVDLQNGVFHAQHPPFQAKQLLENINQLIAYARSKQIPIFAIRHVGLAGTPLATDSPMTQLIPELHIDLSTDIILEKARPNCFFQTDLEQQLKALNIEEIIICGLKTEFCIDTTCRVANDLGFKATLISDAHSTIDSTILSAENIIQHHNTTLNHAFVSLKTCVEFTI